MWSRKKKFDYISLEICLENKKKESDYIFSFYFDDSGYVLGKFEYEYNEVKPLFCQHTTPSEPFHIQICYKYLIFRHLIKPNNTKKQSTQTKVLNQMNV